MTKFTVSITDGIEDWTEEIEASNRSEAAFEAVNRYKGFVSARVVE